MNNKNEGMNPSPNYKPAVTPVKCILCAGFGTFSHGTRTCNGCSGKGFILVPIKETEASND